VPHLLGDPVDRRHAGGQQLTGAGMPALGQIYEQFLGR
jgi:hypothetical protein